MADGFVEQHGGHGGVHTARKAKHHLVVTHFLTQGGHGGLDKRLGSPRLVAAADVHHKVAQQLQPIDRVVHFGMELDSVGRFAFYLITCIVHIVRGADAAVPLGYTLDGVAVAHPHLAAHGDPFHQRVCGIDKLEVGTAVLARAALLHTAAAILGQILCPITHRQQWQTPLDATHVGHRRVGRVTTIGAARKNNALHLLGEGGNLVKRVYFAINIEFAYLACDKLSVLRTKV